MANLPNVVLVPCVLNVLQIITNVADTAAYYRSPQAQPLSIPSLS